MIAVQQRWKVRCKRRVDSCLPVVRQLLCALPPAGTKRNRRAARRERPPIPVFVTSPSGILPGRVGEIEIPSTVEEPAEQEVALERFHVVRQSGHGRSGFIERFFQIAVTPATWPSFDCRVSSACRACFTAFCVSAAMVSALLAIVATR